MNFLIFENFENRNKKNKTVAIIEQTKKKAMKYSELHDEKKRNNSRQGK